MKRIIYVAYILIIMVTSGCQNNNYNNLKIEETPLENDSISIKYLDMDEEESITMKSGGIDNVMIFNLESRDKTIEEIEYWVDYYLIGEFVKPVVKMSSSLNNFEQTKNRLYFLVQSIPDIDKEIWTLTYRQDKNLSTGKFVNDIQEIDSAFSYPFNIKSANKGEIINLAVRVQNKDKVGNSTTNDIQEAIKNNKIVYVLRCKLL